MEIIELLLKCCVFSLGLLPHGNFISRSPFWYFLKNPFLLTKLAHEKVYLHMIGKTTLDLPYPLALNKFQARGMHTIGLGEQRKKVREK